MLSIKLTFTPMKKLLLLLAFLSAIGLKAQYLESPYQRNLTVTDSLWQNIILPDSCYAKMQTDFRDVRIVGITNKNDTIEVPYILEKNLANWSEKKVAFEVINKNELAGERYYTFKITDGNQISRIDLDFNRENYNWSIDLEASHDQKQWFQVLNGYRVVSIKNEFTNYSFSSLHFAKVEYSYFRLKVRDDWFPFFQSANLLKRVGKLGKTKDIKIKEWLGKNDKEAKKTVIDFKLPNAIPITTLQVRFEDKIDYIRPLQLEYLVDSIKTEKGWRRNYRSITSGTLSSFENNSYNFPPVIAKDFRVTIQNNDNLPLSIKTIRLKALIYELKARFPTQGKYYLVYGNKKLRSPNYDIALFKDKIPEAMHEAKISSEIEHMFGKNKKNSQPPQWWLWVLMGALGCSMAFFAIRMLSADKNDNNE